MMETLPQMSKFYAEKVTECRSKGNNEFVFKLERGYSDF